ncbi:MULTISPECIES: AAWKG family protein [unclassified Streptomyces]|uniref:AAWKG family protein n=1 Tax=unclassified Streptomyces TaxID=2593676 RepID=UPI0036E19EDE
MPDPTNDADDYWGQAVKLFTGYPMPARSTLFKGLMTDQNIPLFRMSIDEIGVQAVVDAAEQGAKHTGGQDYDLYFYSNAGGSVKMYHARIVFIGIPMGENGRGRLLDANEYFAWTTFNGTQKDSSGKLNGFDYGPLGQFMGGPKAALDALIDGGTTRNLSYNGASVKDADSVDADSFRRTADAFDRAAQFFVDHAKILAAWEKSLGGDEAAWRGQAAGLFQKLLQQLRKNYDSYVEQQGAGKTLAQVPNTAYTPKSHYADHLMRAQQNLLDQAKNLREAWGTWIQSHGHDPHFHLVMALDDILNWLKLHNFPFIESSPGYGENAVTTFSTKAGFQEPHPEYGNLVNVESWVKVGQKAVDSWNQFIETGTFAVPTSEPAMSPPIETTAQQVIATLNASWADAATPFETPVTTKYTSSLSEFYNKDQTQIAQEAAKKNSEDLNNSLKNLNDGIENMGKGLDDSLNDVTESLNGDGPNGLDDILDDPTKELLNDPAGETSTGPGGGVTTDLNPGLTTDLGGDSTQTNPNSVLPPSLLNPGGGTGVNAGGGTVALNKDGTISLPNSTGGTTTYNPKTGALTTVGPDGKPTVRTLNPGQSVTDEDGNVISRREDGTLAITRPDGSQQVIDPGTGKVTTTDANGHTTVSDLNPDTGLERLTAYDDLRQDLNRDLGSALDLNGQSSLTTPTGSVTHDLNDTAYGGGGSVGSSGSQGTSDYEEYDSTFQPGGTLGGPRDVTTGTGAATTDGTDAASGSAGGGVPLNSMPMGGGMGGMGGMSGGGQNGSSSGERVRNVLTESGSTGARGRNARPSGGRRGTEEDRSARRGTTATTSSGAPVPAGGAQGDRVTTGGRDRVHWVAEDEDVWGTEDGGTPAVIGR